MVMIEKNNFGDLLKYEAQNMYSREESTIAHGQNLKLGTILGRARETGVLKQFNPTAEDGTETAVAVLLTDVDASRADTPAVALVREGIISANAVIWPDSITDEQKASAVESLKNYGIVVRKGA